MFRNTFLKSSTLYLKNIPCLSIVCQSLALGVEWVEGIYFVRDWHQDFPLQFQLLIYRDVFLRSLKWLSLFWDSGPQWTVDWVKSALVGNVWVKKTWTNCALSRFFLTQTLSWNLKSHSQIAINGHYLVVCLRSFKCLLKVS